MNKQTVRWTGRVAVGLGVVGLGVALSLSGVAGGGFGLLESGAVARSTGFGPGAGGGAAPGYYASVDPRTPESLRATLHDVIDDHTRLDYTDASDPDVWDMVAAAEENPNNPSNVLDIYRNASYPKAFAGNSNYQREHAWPSSHGFPRNVVANYPYTDGHHLFAADGSYNGSRGNKPYRFCTSGSCGERKTEVNNGQGGVGQPNATEGNGRDGTGTWETWIGRRGDVARALLYMDVRYEGDIHGIEGVAEPDLRLTDDQALINPDSSVNKTIGYMGELSALLAWHEQDPVDAVNAFRNSAIEMYQGNRNPFIDHPEWVDCVFNGVCDTPWLNEFHYDNAGGDTGEFVELVALAKMDLTGWTLLGYNGNDGAVYETISLTGTVPSDTSCFGFVTIDFPGMQNGPDGLALADPDGNVRWFISYEGAFVATSGPAAGMTSTPLLVEETGSTPVGSSLQLAGAGAGVSAFTWRSPAAATPGAANNGQMLEGDCAGDMDPPAQPVAWINEFHYDNASGDVGEFVEIAGTAGIDLSGWTVLGYNGADGGVYGSVALSGVIPDEDGGLGALSFTFSGMQNGPDGLALVDDAGVVVEFIAYEGSLSAKSGAAAGMTAQDVGVSETGATPIGFSLQRTGVGCVAGDFAWSGPAADSPGMLNTKQMAGDCSGGGGDPQPSGGTAWINELHYDNTGGDTGEFVEVAGTAGLDLTGWELVGYNGSGGGEYATLALSGVIPNESNGGGALSFAFGGLQNGPDALALVDAQGALVEFVAYESTFTATDGPADGQTADLLPVEETSSTPVGFSLQRTGSGCAAGEFSWTGPADDSPGSLNTGQSIAGCN